MPQSYFLSITELSQCHSETIHHSIVRYTTFTHIEV